MQAIGRNAEPIVQGVQHINRTGGVVAGALPLLYGMAEGIVISVTPPSPSRRSGRPPRPASGTRRSRLGEGVGYHPDEEPRGLTAGSGHSPMVTNRRFGRRLRVWSHRSRRSPAMEPLSVGGWRPW